MAEQAARSTRPLPVVSPPRPVAQPRLITETRNLTSETFRALSDPARLELLALIAAQGPICVCHLTDALPYSQPTISRHLGTLRRAGLVSSRREGAWVYYETDVDMLAVAREFLDQLEASLHRPHAADHCDDPA